MTQHVDELVKELRRRNHEKKRALSSGSKKGIVHTAKAQSAKDRKTDKLIDEATAARSVDIKGYKDLHEVASRIKGKK
jgi:hypothetical protein